MALLDEEEVEVMDEMEEARRPGSPSALFVNPGPGIFDECLSAHTSLASSSVLADVAASKTSKSSVCKESLWIHDPRSSIFLSVRHSFPAMQGLSDRAVGLDLRMSVVGFRG